MGRYAILGTVLIAADLLLALPAFAHADLILSVPAAVDAAVAEPASEPITELRLTFSEQIELAFSGVTVTSSDGTAIETGEATLDPADGATLVVPLVEPLPAGEYTVQWSVASTDGHSTSGSYHITTAP